VTIPPPSALSTISRVMRQRLKDAFGNDVNFDITIDTPAAVAKKRQESTGTNLLNLFFYRFEPAQFFADAGAPDRWYIRAQCLVTPFSESETDTDPNQSAISEGEVDLRVLGEVLRYFHENPIIPNRSNGEADAYLQVVLTPLSSQEINQIWATQHDVAYRPSLLYEVGLLPIEPQRRASPPLPVVAGGIHLHPRANMDGAAQKPPASPAVWPSPQLESGVGPGWIPVLSFVSNGVATQSLSAQVGANVDLWIGAPQSEKVDLIWQQVERGTWSVLPNGLVTDVAVPAQADPPGNGVIDPSRAGAATIVKVAVPIDKPGQLVLFAQRRAADGSTLKSNPLIVSITGASS
jgi:hypothetical protein